MHSDWSSDNGRRLIKLETRIGACCTKVDGNGDSPFHGYADALRIFQPRCVSSHQSV